MVKNLGCDHRTAHRPVEQIRFDGHPSRGIDEPELASDPIFSAGVSTHSFLKAIHQPSSTPLGVLRKEMLNPWPEQRAVIFLEGPFEAADQVGARFLLVRASP